MFIPQREKKVRPSEPPLFAFPLARGVFADEVLPTAEPRRGSRYGFLSGGTYIFFLEKPKFGILIKKSIPEQLFMRIFTGNPNEMHKFSPQNTFRTKREKG